MARSVFVGDVHGCSEELEELLARVALTDADQLVLVGDLVAKGPDSGGVLRLARRHRALAVLGNHDQRVLAAYRARRAGQPGPKLSPAHQRVLEELEEPDWRYLEALPLYLDLSQHEVRVVHAGVVPGVPLTEQEPFFLTHLRALLPDGTPTDKRRGTPWAQRYLGPPHVVFGHDAIGGLQLEPWATGLDTGCVYGQALTALVLEAGQGAPPVDERRGCLAQVAARRAYVSLV